MHRLPPSAPSAKNRLLSSGLELASAQGVSEITLSSLSQKAHLSKSGIFAHFKSKEELQVAILDESGAVGSLHVARPSEKEPPGIRRLVAILCRWFGWASRSGLPGGCPAAAGMFEYDDKESMVREKLVQMDASWRAYLKAVVLDAVHLRELRSDTEAEQLVWELMGIYLAHHTSYRFVRAPDADKRAEIALRSLLERYIVADNPVPDISIQKYVPNPAGRPS